MAAASVFRFFCLLFVIFYHCNSQITFSRNWVRGKYPDDGVEDNSGNPIFMRSSKALFSLSDYPESVIADGAAHQSPPVSKEKLFRAIRKLKSGYPIYTKMKHEDELGPLLPSIDHSYPAAAVIMD